jgi:predicted RNA-binding Zn-ribbon protein involved in translation (DUF1610 family)
MLACSEQHFYFECPSCGSSQVYSCATDGKFRCSKCREKFDHPVKIVLTHPKHMRQSNKFECPNCFHKNGYRRKKTHEYFCKYCGTVTSLDKTVSEAPKPALKIDPIAASLRLLREAKHV